LSCVSRLKHVNALCFNDQSSAHSTEPEERGLYLFQYTGNNNPYCEYIASKHETNGDYIGGGIHTHGTCRCSSFTTVIYMCSCTGTCSLQSTNALVYYSCVIIKIINIHCFAVVELAVPLLNTRHCKARHQSLQSAAKVSNSQHEDYSLFGHETPCGMPVFFLWKLILHSDRMQPHWQYNDGRTERWTW